MFWRGVDGLAICLGTINGSKPAKLVLKLSSQLYRQEARRHYAWPRFFGWG